QINNFKYIINYIFKRIFCPPLTATDKRQFQCRQTEKNCRDKSGTPLFSKYETNFITVHIKVIPQ
ncbi:unnamed protein product, partial [Tenebrio molitor]